MSDEEWKEIFQEQSSKYYYWNPATNNVNWCIPGSKWRKFKAPETERVYYCHAETGTTVWQLPQGVRVPQSGVRASIATAEGAVIPTMGRASIVRDHPPPAGDDEMKTNVEEGKQDTKESNSEKPDEHSEKKEFPESSHTDAQALKIKGNAHFNKKEFAEAKDCYDNAILLDSKCANFYFNRSAVFFCMNDLTNALKDAQLAVELAPENASALTRLGFTLMKMNPPQYGEAEEIYERALKLDPKNSRISKGLAKVKQLRSKS